MSILIIGNGFDLAHHLPTQYSDFLDFVKACKEPDDTGDDAGSNSGCVNRNLIIRQIHFCRVLVKV